MSLVAHIVTQNLPPEPTATQSLTYILRSAPELAVCLTDLLGPSVAFKLGHLESELKFGDDRPDLTIFDSDGRHRVFVENKFWAGLTDAQPVQYLRALPDDMPSGLLFILPEQRIPTVWEELKRRSGDAYEIGDESSADGVTRLQMGFRIMCATSWQHVLRMLERASPSDVVRLDVLQLAGLAKFGESGGYLPLSGEELSNVGIPRRMIHYCDLVDAIVRELKSRRVARMKGLRPTHSWSDTGRYFSGFNKFGLWLGVALMPWQDTGISPVWLRVDSPGNKSDYSNLGEDYFRLEELFEDVQVGKDVTYFPIRLQRGVERETLIRDAANQVQRIAEKFREIKRSAGRARETA